MPADCPAYIGNSDAYGLGIRLGIYLQWATSVINKWVFEDRDHLRDVLNENAIFLLSIFIATIVLAANGTPEPHAVDIILLEHIFFGSIYTVFFDGHIIDNMERISSFWGILFKWAMPTGMAALSVWFWSRGLDKTEATCGGTIAFIFAPVDAMGGARKAFIFFACANLWIWASALSGTISDRIHHLMTVFGLFRKKNTSESFDEKESRALVRIWKEICTPMKEASVNESSLLYNRFRDMIRQLLLMKDPAKTGSTSTFAYRARLPDMVLKLQSEVPSRYSHVFDIIVQAAEYLEAGSSLLEGVSRQQRDLTLDFLAKMQDRKKISNPTRNMLAYLTSRLFSLQGISASDTSTERPEVENPTFNKLQTFWMSVFHEKLLNIISLQVQSGITLPRS